MRPQKPGSLINVPQIYTRFTVATYLSLIQAASPPAADHLQYDMRPEHGKMITKFLSPSFPRNAVQRMRAISESWPDTNTFRQLIVSSFTQPILELHHYLCRPFLGDLRRFNELVHHRRTYFPGQQSSESQPSVTNTVKTRTTFLQESREDVCTPDFTRTGCSRSWLHAGAEAENRKTPRWQTVNRLRMDTEASIGHEHVDISAEN